MKIYNEYTKLNIKTQTMLFLITCDADLKSTIKNNVELFDVDCGTYIHSIPDDDGCLFECFKGFGEQTRLYIIVTSDINFLLNLKTVCDCECHLSRYDSDSTVTLFKLNNNVSIKWYIDMVESYSNVIDYEIIRYMGHSCTASECYSCSDTNFIWIESKNELTNFQYNKYFKKLYTLKV